MNPASPSEEALYQQQLGWCLLREVADDGMLTPDRYWRIKDAQGTQEGWLTLANRRRALQMFVLFDRILLSDWYDVDLASTSLVRDGHVRSARTVHGGLSLRGPVLESEILQAYLPLLQPALAARGHRVADRLILDLAVLYKAERDLEARSFLGSGPLQSLEVEREILEAWLERDSSEPDPARRKEVLQRLAAITDFKAADQRYRALRALVVDEIAALHESLRLAELGVPTFGFGANVPRLTSRRSQRMQGLRDDTPCLVDLYFKNVVCAPAPTTLSEALSLRENPSVQAWREQVRSWATKLAMGQTALKAVEQEIKEANGYIEGARSLGRLVPKWSLAITVPAGIALEFVPGLQPLGTGLLAISAVELYGWGAEQAVTSPNRLQHKWIMVSNVANRRR